MCVRTHLSEYMDAQKKKAPGDWKMRVKNWHKTSGELYRYMKNPAPAKAVMVMTEDGPTQAYC